MTEKNIIEDLASRRQNRRSFAKKLGLAGAALGTGVATRGSAQTASAAANDAAILNFALNLEYLEAEFYAAAVAGTNLQTLGVTVTGSGNSGPTTGGSQVNFTDPLVAALAQELAMDEATHVRLLQASVTLLGGTPIAKPAINLNALGMGFGSMAAFLTLARIFEDIGATAYAGAAPLLQTPAVIGAAARIIGVEAYHGGNIRFNIARLGIPTTLLDGADHLPPLSGSQYIPVDSNALIETRTPAQVLYLAYGGANLSSGAFFPSGVNGTLATMSSATPATTDGAYITASPNPITNAGTGDGTTTITWSAPSAQIIQIRVGSPTGPLFTDNLPSGSMQTGAWVTQGTTFYLQDVTGGKPLNYTNTLATVLVNL